MPEVRRLLLALAEPPERFSLCLAWSEFRRRHQAVAKRCHAARRARHHPIATGTPTIQSLASPVLELTDDRWARVLPLLPPQKPVTGRPMLDHRRIVGGMLWVVRTGNPWHDLPADFGPWKTVYGRYRRWRDEGLWERIIDILQQTGRTSPAS